jgi:glycine/D-amino acid oxidase-like deaminating enzyme
MPRAPAGSLWDATACPAPSTHPLDGETKADAVVVGGGFCGLSCALHLAEAGVDTVLLEAQGPGWGASGRNGGQVIPCFKADPETLISRLGSDLGERMSSLGASGGALVADLIERYGIDCAYRRDGWILGLHGKSKLAAMESRARQWQARGRPVSLIGRDETAALLGTDLYEGGYLDPEGGALNPLSFARGLATAAIGQGARLHTGSAAVEIKEDDGYWRVSTNRGTVTAQQVVVATGAYSADFIPVLKRSVLPVQSIQIATPPLSSSVRKSILPHGHVVSDSRRLLLYFRLQEQGRLVFGGRGSLNGDRISPVHLDQLYSTLRHTFPRLGDIGFEHAWAGLVDITPDRNLRIHTPQPGLVAVIGFNGRGVAIAPAVGRAVAEAIVAGSFKDLPLPVTPMRPVPFHGLRLPAMALAVQWYRLLDRWETR